ncbi:hypothetical protein CBI38_21530 [Rhodococcus oxybenzonivorans]|uniref:Uncharacterized protein n=1 Tax=Rhodococcus oxybenzonivorans TaxID=1990687 RepID=A0A2S2BYN6_9NOCA|nr:MULTISPECIES: hypothetical protein [Rhodococcus]AWK73755.1 hypothetical protein CBI38_21530 [Rhodococcus oxybenzonivorans]QTJ68502.1 hypothetical protein HYG77_24940 [Rhodococcus sp. ZPP]
MPHLNTAQVLADFLGTRGGRSALNGGYAAALPEIPGSGVGAKDIASPEADDLALTRLISTPQRWTNLFQS